MNVLSTYLSYNDGFCGVDPNATSKYSMYALANSDDGGDPIVSLSCRYMSEPIPKWVFSTQKTISPSDYLLRYSCVLPTRGL